MTAGYTRPAVSNSQGSVASSNAMLTVLPPSPPFFTSEPESETVYTGQSFTWWARTDGSPPSEAVWQKDGTNLLEETFDGPWGYGPSLTFSDISIADAGSYTLWVTNDYGSVESSNAVLTVIPSIAPVITRQPRSLDVAEGVNTWMSVTATGAPGPDYRWAREGDPPPVPSPGLIPPQPVDPILNSNPRHPFNNAAISNAGIYFATVNNYAGSATSKDALLTVLPAITNIGCSGEDAVDVFATNGLAYLARGTNGLAILNVNNPASPQLVGNCDTPGYALAVQVWDNFAFVADGSSGLQIISITNPSAPIIVGHYNTPGYASDLAVQSNLVFLADGHAGLVILNASNPAAPSIVSGYSTNISADYVCLIGNHALFSSPFEEIVSGTNRGNVAGMVVVDISNPTHPFETGRLSSGIGRIVSRGQLIFGPILNGFQRLQIVTITNPAQPTVIGTFNDYYSTNFLRNHIAVSDVRVVNDLAFLVGNSGGQSQLYVLDVRDPTEPIPVGYYTDASQPTTLAVDGKHVYIAGYDSPLEIIGTPFDTSPVAAPALSVLARDGMSLHIQGRHGLHYNVECTDRLPGDSWQTLKTILLINDNAVIQVPAGPATRFFRIKQLD